MRATLGEAAAAGVRSRNSYLQAQYRRLAGRRGKKRALLAVGALRAGMPVALGADWLPSGATSLGFPS